MNIYVIDWGWAGSASCVADSIEEASDIFTKMCPASYDDKDRGEIVEHSIARGLIHYNMGDYHGGDPVWN